MGFGFMGLIPLLVVGVIVWLAVESTRHRGTGETTSPSEAGPQVARLAEAAGAPALDILKERYARGEIDRDEYLAVRRDLASS